MNENIFYLVCEDRLSEAILRRLVRQFCPRFKVGSVYGLCGKDWIRQKIDNFNRASRSVPYLVLVDLDQFECAPALIANWMPRSCNENLILRIAVREVESWLLAARESMSRYLKIPLIKIPADPETIEHPKEMLINLARRSRSKHLAADIAPQAGSTARIGPDYNSRLSVYVSDHWDIDAAQNNCPSLAKAVNALQGFSQKSAK